MDVASNILPIQRVEPWPPHSPDRILSEILSQAGKLIGRGSLGSVLIWNGLALKTPSFQHEFDMMKKAGHCSVTPIARALEIVSNRPVMKGLIMALEAPFDCLDINGAEKTQIKDEMIRLVTTLHEQYQMIHGDIKPSNFLRCRDGSLRLCDFDSARLVSDDPEEWEGLVTEEFLSPDRKYHETGKAPCMADDIYALGLSIWSLYVGKDVFPVEDMEEVLRDRRTVDLSEINNIETRNFVRTCLRNGGALV